MAGIFKRYQGHIVSIQSLENNEYPLDKYESFLRELFDLLRVDAEDEKAATTIMRQALILTDEYTPFARAINTYRDFLRTDAQDVKDKFKPIYFPDADYFYNMYQDILKSSGEQRITKSRTFAKEMTSSLQSCTELNKPAVASLSKPKGKENLK